MTTLRELGEMLIEVADNGRVLQCRFRDDCEWAELSNDDSFNLGAYDYRLKPKVTYYRAFVDECGNNKLSSSYYKHDSLEKWKGIYSLFTHLKDFEIES